nr:response regulator [Labrys sp. LIt4]
MKPPSARNSKWTKVRTSSSSPSRPANSRPRSARCYLQAEPEQRPALGVRSPEQSVFGLNARLLQPVVSKRLCDAPPPLGSLTEPEGTRIVKQQAFAEPAIYNAPEHHTGSRKPAHDSRETASGHDDIDSSPPVTVVLVDDDNDVRLITADLLEDAGFRVLQAGRAEAALDILASNGDARVLITDVRMPGPMSGYDLALKARERWPSLEIMFVSGFGLPERRRLYFDCLLVSKPFNPDEFVSQVRGLAERAS